MSDNVDKSFDEFEKIIEVLSSKKPTNNKIYHINQEEPEIDRTPPENIVQFNQDTSRKKSVNRIKLKKNKLKITTKKIKKGLIILCVTTIIGLGTTFTIPKVATHYETEKIKEQTLEEFYIELEETGLDPDKITAEGIIYNSTPEYIKEHLFEIFQIINITYKPNEAPKIFDLMVQKAGIGHSFDEYLLEQGYFMDIDGKRIPSITKWENDIEAQKLAEKEARRGGR